MVANIKTKTLAYQPCGHQDKFLQDYYESIISVQQWSWWYLCYSKYPNIRYSIL